MLGWALFGVIILALVALSLQSIVGSFMAQECRMTAEGSPSAPVVIKYFSSDSCVACTLQKPVLAQLLEAHGSHVRIEKFPLESCSAEAAANSVRGVPAFIIEYSNKRELLSGFQQYDELERMVCSLTDC